MYVRDDVNEFGTPVAAFVCDTCGGSFTVCPMPSEGQRGMWNNCMAPECDSYDIDRDVEAIIGFGWGCIQLDSRHDPRCISLTESEFNEHCDCATWQIIDDFEGPADDNRG